MPKNHLKRIAAPKTWLIKRKNNTFIMRPRAGPHPFQYGMPLSLVLRDLIKVARTSKESKQILCNKDVFVDKRKRLDKKYPVGLMDVIEFPEIGLVYRMVLDLKGRLTVVKADVKESNTKLSRVLDKTKILGGKTQLNLSDGRNVIIESDSYAVGDTVQLLLPDQKIQNHFKLEKGACVLLTGGKHAGSLVNVEEINKDKIIIKSSKNEKLETLKKYAFVVGKDKPILSSLIQNN